MKKLVKEHAQQFGMLIVITIIITSCSPKVASVSTTNTSHIAVVSHKDTLTKAPMIANKRIAIDTLLYPFRANMASSANTYAIDLKTKKFYELNGLSTQWLGNRAPGSYYYNLIDILKHAEWYGLNEADYDVEELQQRVDALYEKNQPLSREIVALDIALTKTCFRFTSHISAGRITNPAYGKNVWIRNSMPGNDADVTALSKVSSPDDLLVALESLQPSSVQYTRLRTALMDYRKLEEITDALMAPGASVKIKPGEKHQLIPLIRKKILKTDLASYTLPFDTLTKTSDSLLYDVQLADGVKKFQRRHGLTADGIIGEKTIRFMDQSFKSKAAVISVNMERLRWAPKMEDEHYIEVNIPEYMMRIYDLQKQAMSMRVIVGAVDKPTPVFSETLEYVMFSPTWTVPTSIIKEEIIPRLQRDSAYYSGKNYQFFRNNLEIDPSTEKWNENVNPHAYRIVQKPGDDNSLGRVKFVMPNSMNVYLHDTPNHRPFSKDYRALSHGCIRLSDPSGFAAFLLRDQRGWEIERIDKAMKSESPTVVHLKTTYKVYTSYRTAWVDDDGVVNFREDIYGYDQYQIKMISSERKEKRLAEASEVKTAPVESL